MREGYRKELDGRGKGGCWFDNVSQRVNCWVGTQLVNTSVHIYIDKHYKYTFWFSVKIMIFSTKFISSISCTLLHHIHHICCEEGDECYRGNHDVGHDHLLQSSPDLGGRTA